MLNTWTMYRKQASLYKDYWDGRLQAIVRLVTVR